MAMAQITPQTLRTYGVFGSLTLIIMLPLLLPGYILTLDMVFTPRLRLPTNIGSSYLFHAGLWLLNFIFPSQVLQKIMLAAILLLSGLGAYWLMRHLQAKRRAGEYDTWSAYLAGTVYMINPFTYSRFMAGQYAVLLGYALLPFFIRASLQFFALPGRRIALVVTAWVIAISIVSIHTLGLVAIILLAQLACTFWRQRNAQKAIRPLIKYCLLGAVLFIVASSYWLVPLALGSSSQARAIAGFTSSDHQAFTTTGGSTAKRFANVLQLRGFWAEGHNLYILPQNRLPLWPLVMISIWVLVGIGAVALWRDGHQDIVVVLAASAGCAALLAATAAGAGLAHLPLLSGYREPQKFVGLIALAFAIFAGWGAAAMLGWSQKRRSQTLFSLLFVGLLLLPLLYTPTMFWGFAGQLRPRQYPSDWFAINNQLNTDTSSGSVLFLPWHLYMSYDFAGRIIASPAPDFFDKPTIASNELELLGAAPTAPDTQKSLLASTVLPQAPSRTDLARQLQRQHIKYVLLAKEYDFRTYDYLHKQAALQLVQETSHLKLYEVANYE